MRNFWMFILASCPAYGIYGLDPYHAVDVTPAFSAVSKENDTHPEQEFTSKKTLIGYMQLGLGVAEQFASIGYIYPFNIKEESYSLVYGNISVFPHIRIGQRWLLDPDTSASVDIALGVQIRLSGEVHYKRVSLKAQACSLLGPSITGTLTLQRDLSMLHFRMFGPFPVPTALTFRAFKRCAISVSLLSFLPFFGISIFDRKIGPPLDEEHREILSTVKKIALGVGLATAVSIKINFGKTPSHVGASAMQRFRTGAPFDM